MKKNGGTEETLRKVGNDRTVIELGGSLYVNIPMAFVEKHGIRAGDILTVVVGEVMKVVVPT